MGKFQTTKVGEQVSNLAGLAFVLRCVASGVLFVCCGGFVIGWQGVGVPFILIAVASLLYFVGWQVEKFEQGSRLD